MDKIKETKKKTTKTTKKKEELDKITFSIDANGKGKIKVDPSKFCIIDFPLKAKDLPLILDTMNQYLGYKEDEKKPWDSWTLYINGIDNDVHTSGVQVKDLISTYGEYYISNFVLLHKDTWCVMLSGKETQWQPKDKFFYTFTRVGDTKDIFILPKWEIELVTPKPKKTTKKKETK